MAVALCEIGILFLTLKCGLLFFAFLASVGAIVLGLFLRLPMKCLKVTANVLLPHRDKRFVCCMHDGQW